MSDVLVCPVCTVSVERTSSMCLSCHLPIRDVLSNQQAARRSGAQHARRLRRAIFGLLVYAAIGWWCWLQLPTSLAFVGPGAVVGAWLHAVKGRPWFGLLAFAAIVGALPLIFWPSMVTELLGTVTALG